MVRAFALAVALTACGATGDRPPVDRSPVASALALGMVPLSLDARGVPQMLRAAMPVAKNARALVTDLAPAWGVREVPELAEIGVIQGSITRFEQRIGGVPMDRGELRVMTGGGLVTGVMIDADTPRAGAFVLDERAAIARAVARVHGPAVAHVERAAAHRVWFGDGGALVAAWKVEQESRSARAEGTWATIVAADDGRVLAQRSLVQSEAYTYRVFAEANGHPALPMARFAPHPTGVPDASLPGPATSSLVTVVTADPWLAAGATETAGNNVDAYNDVNPPQGLPGDFRAQVTAPGLFDRTYDPALEPLASTAQEMAAITQLFYTIDWQHDFWYAAGFTEAAGNAQVDNYGRGGAGGDPLLLEAEDGGLSHLNNANMHTPEDGMSPKMQVFVFTGNDERSIAVSPGPYALPQTMFADFGPPAFDVTATLVRVTNTACVSPNTDVTGKIAVVDAGGCTPKAKAKALEAAGAAGMVFVDTQDSPAVMRLLDDTMIAAATLPVLAVPRGEGATLSAALAGGPLTATLHRAHRPAIDGVYDATLISHEFGHYLHMRLSVCTNTACLSMSEGWGDFLALLMTVHAGDALHGAYPICQYADAARSSDPMYFGIRRVPYSADLAIDGLTFRDMRRAQPPPAGFPFLPNPYGNDELHNAGEVWASALWQAYVALQDAGGDFAATHAKVARYVVAGLAMTPPDTTPTEARDALLAVADAANPGDAAVMAPAFAVRGMGACARSAPRNSDTFNEIVQSTAVSGDPVLGPMTVADTGCDQDGILDAGETATVTVPVTNHGFGPLADVTVTLATTTPGVTVTSAPIAIPMLAPFATTTASFQVTLADRTATAGAFTVRVAATNACAASTDTPLALRLNVDDVPASSSDDHFDAATTPWHAQTLWTRERTSAVDGYWHAPSPQLLADSVLLSPPLTAGSTPVTVTFMHRYAFDLDDSGVVEYSTDGGTTWLDVSTLVAPGYTGVARAYGSPIDGRAAYVDASAGYPARAKVTLALGTQLAGKTFQLRFRIASSDFDFPSDASPGWDIDDLTTTGLGTPFIGVVPTRATCPPDHTEPMPDAGADAPETSGGGGGGCCSGSDGGNLAAAGAVLAMLARRRRRPR